MRRIPFAMLLAVTACYPVEAPRLEGLASFDVSRPEVYLPSANGPRQRLNVVTPCAREHGGQDQVPPERRGTPNCPYVIPRGEVELDVVSQALDRSGIPLVDFSGPVSFRVVPGDLTGAYPFRWAQSVAGVAKGTVKVAHLYGEVRLWVEDAPPQPIYADGGVTGTTETLPVEPARRTLATGLSPILYFEEPTLAKIQIPDGFDNRSSPLVGQFMTIGSNPEGGKLLRQSCPDDPEHDGAFATMVVTGTDPTGFFVTDLTACRMKEDVKDPVTGSTVVRLPEPDGFLPGTFGSLFIYNYSFPDGLDQGDLIWTVSGAVQEFTGTTQLTFPAWSIRKKARSGPPEEWDLYLKQVKPVELNLRHCGLDNVLAPFLTDTMCGQNKRNLKLESLESGLVKLRQVRFPETFARCDLNASGDVPFFCEAMRPLSSPPVSCRSASDCAAGSCDRVTSTCSDWAWGGCDFSGAPEDPVQKAERDCNMACMTGTGPYAGKLCTEETSFETFGQFAVEMAGPGPLAAGLDPSLPARVQSVALSARSTAVTSAFSAGAELNLWCDAPAHLATGGQDVVATPSDPVLPAHTLRRLRLGANQTHVAFLADGASRAAQCAAAENPHVRINVVTRDAIPDLQPNCDPQGADAERATRCRELHAATFDVTGHLRQVQPGRPRWTVLPRDADDVCCRPGPGLQCPKPIKPCID